jgi:hypothetical protein
VAPDEALGKWTAKDWTLHYQPVKPGGNVDKPQRGLLSRENYEDVELIFDLRTEGRMEAWLGGQPGLGMPGQKGWRRFHIVMKGGMMTVSVDGKAVVENQKVEVNDGPIGLGASDVADFANVFVLRKQ